MALYNTLQEVFDRAYTGLAKQDFVQSISGGGCSYRGANYDGRQTACAIGQCIPDELYSSEIEGSLGALRNRHEELFFKVFDPSIGVVALAELQGAHDVATSPLSMQDELSKFATKYSLTIPEVEAK